MKNVITEEVFNNEETMFEFLDDLRGSGETNMFGASPYLVYEFDLTRKQANAVLTKWMRTYADRNPHHENC